MHTCFLFRLFSKVKVTNFVPIKCLHWSSVVSPHLIIAFILATVESQPGSRSNGEEEQGRGHPSGDKESLMDQEKLHSLKLLLLDELLLHLPKLKDVGGVQAIPFMQVCYISFLRMNDLFPLVKDVSILRIT